MKENYQKILELIIGKEECEKIITKTAKKYNKGGYSINNFEIIMESYFIAILLIGFSKKKVEIDKYSIHFVNKPDININTKEFCEEYKDEIDKIEDYKFNLLRRLISKDNERRDENAEE